MIAELLEGQPRMTTEQIVAATGYAKRTVQKALQDIGAVGERPGRNAETLWALKQDGDD